MPVHYADPTSDAAPIQPLCILFHAPPLRSHSQQYRTERVVRVVIPSPSAPMLWAADIPGTVVRPGEHPLEAARLLLGGYSFGGRGAVRLPKCTFGRIMATHDHSSRIDIPVHKASSTPHQTVLQSAAVSSGPHGPRRQHDPRRSAAALRHHALCFHGGHSQRARRMAPSELVCGACSSVIECAHVCAYAWAHCAGGLSLCVIIANSPLGQK